MNYKDLGNEALEKGNFKKAVEWYTLGLKNDPSNATLYSNRSVAHLKLKHFIDSLSDAKKAIEISPKWIKGYFRAASAAFALNHLKDSKKYIIQGLEIEDNPALKELLEKVNLKVKELFWGDLPFLPLKYLMINKKSMLYKKIELYPTDNMNDEDIKSFGVTEKDLKHLIQMSRFDKFQLESKTDLILKLIGTIDVKYIENEDLKLLFPLISIGYLDNVIKIFAKFDYLDPIFFRNLDSQGFFQYLNLTLKSHQKDKKYLDTIKPILKYHNECLKYYFEVTKDESFFNELIEISLEEDSDFGEDESFSFYHVLNILGKKIDLENYPFEQCLICDKPLGMCKEEKLINFEEAFEQLKNKFEKGDYLETMKLCMEIKMNKEVSKFMINSYINLNRMSEALIFIKKLSIDKEEKIELLKKIKINENIKPELHIPSFDLNFTQLNKKEIEIDEEIEDYIEQNEGNDLLGVFWEDGTWYYKTFKDDKRVEYYEENEAAISQKITENEIIIFNQENNEIEYYDLEKKTTRLFIFDCDKNPCDFYPFKNYLITENYNDFSKKRYLRIYDNETFKLIHSYGYSFNFDIVDCFTHEDTFFLSCRIFQAVFEMDLKTGHHLKTFELQDPSSCKILFDDHYLCAKHFVTNDLTYLAIYDRKTTELLHYKNIPHSSFYLNEYLFLTNESSFEIEIYKPHSMELMHTIKTPFSDFHIGVSLYIKECRIYGINEHCQYDLMRIPIENDKRIRKCKSCYIQMTDIKPKICGRCFQVSYCSKKCQVSHWPKHKFSCNLLK